MKQTLWVLVSTTLVLVGCKMPDEDGSKNGRSVVQLSASADHTCAWSESGEAVCWGDNTFGQAVIDSGLMGHVASIATGAASTCVLTPAGGVKCWGNNSYGQLGDGSFVDSSIPVDVLGLDLGVSELAGSSTSFTFCAVKDSGSVFCWGHNEFGQVGSGDISDHSIPQMVVGISTAKAIAVSAAHACALLTSGGVKCWGGNSAGELGDGTTTNSFTAVDVAGLGSGVASISAGYRHTCAVMDSGAVECWGYNNAGQLGNGTTANSAVPVPVSGLSAGASLVAAGGYHSCAITADRELKCWGSNGEGALGQGNLINSSIPVSVVGLTSGVTALSLSYHSCAATTNHSVKCWGDNYFQQLGIQSTSDDIALPKSVIRLIP